MAEETMAAGPGCDVPPSVDVKKLVEEDKKNRAQACEKEINEVLKKYNCSLATLQLHVNGQPQEVQIRVDPK
jgi:hypothetical protein